jgi:RNA polymerase sigma-70 factor (ECF subfamily)
MSTAPDLPDPLLAWPQGSDAVSDAASEAPAESSPEPVIALEDALRHAAPRLRRYATRRLGDAHEAEEVVQEALLRACQHSGGFATEDDLMAWSTVVTGRLVIDRLRLRTRSVSVAEVPEHARLGRDTADVVVARAEARAALDALEAMPSRQAAVLWSREVEGLSYDEIADRFALTEPTVRSLLHRARRTLRREYAARGGTLPVAGLAVLAPWRGGVHNVSRLRDVARQILAPAGAGAAAISILGVTTLFGGGAHHLTTPAVNLAPSQSAVATSRLPSTTSGPSATAAALATSGGATPPSSTAHAGHPFGFLNHQCARTPKTGETSGRAGLNCHYDSTTPALVVRVPLPNNPTGLHYVGITSNKVDCRKLPKAPIARCVQQQNPSTSVSRSE